MRTTLILNMGVLGEVEVSFLFNFVPSTPNTYEVQGDPAEIGSTTATINGDRVPGWMLDLLLDNDSVMEQLIEAGEANHRQAEETAREDYEAAQAVNRRDP